MTSYENQLGLRTNVEVYPTIAVFVKNTEQLFHKLVAGSALKQNDDICKFLNKDLLQNGLILDVDGKSDLALSDRRCEHFFHLLLRHPTVWAVVHEALTNSRTQNTFDIMYCQALLNNRSSL